MEHVLLRDAANAAHQDEGFECLEQIFLILRRSIRTVSKEGVGGARG